jgi:hypothetical protein
MKPGANLELSLCALLLLASSCSGRDISLGEGREPETPAPAELPGYETPRAIAGLGGEDAKDDDPALSADLLTLYFNSQREGGQGQEDIWISQRATIDAVFAEPMPERALNTEQRETGIALSANGLNLWFSSDRKGGAGGLDVYLATRDSVGSAWSLARVPELSSEDDDLVSSVTVDGRRLFLARRDDAEDDYDLFIAERENGAGRFASPLPITALNTDEEESDAVFLEGIGGLVFTRDEQLVYAAHYPSDDEPLEVAKLTELNSDEDDRDAWFSADLDYVVFSSDRSGTYLLYEAWRQP